LLIHYDHNWVVTDRQVTVVPMSATVTEMVKILAKANGMTELVLHSKEGKCSMIPLELQEWIMQKIFMMTSNKTLTMSK